MVKGYICIQAIKEVQELAEENGWACYIEEIGDDEKAPTLLSNKESISGGEELVKFYAVPGYRAIDPSNILFFSFAVFFAMIMSDFGYALILAVLLLFANKSLNTNRTSKRIKVLSWTLVLTSMIWGMMIGSYFGVSPENIPSLSNLTNFKILDMSDTDTMMRVSIFVGIFHVVLANLVVAWKFRNSLMGLSKIGWGLITISGIYYIPWIMFGAVNSYANEAKYSFLTGIVLVFLFSSNSKNVVKRIIDGLLGLTKLSAVFGDVLSYLRIFALGLASASLALTFNDLAVQVVNSMPTLGHIMAFIILLAGHSINFALGIMSGVVHGLRLNVIEFFNWSISDEGYPFNAFSKMEVRKWINL